jgi:hypothetical protein
MFKILLTSFALLLSSLAWAQEDPMITVELTVEAANSNAARTKILTEAMEKVATERIIAMIGQERFQQNRTAIRQRVLDQAARFIPVANPGPIQSVGPGQYSMRVDLRLSESSLKAVLQKQGLLYELDGPAKIFPAWGVVDKVNALTYRWWIDENTGGREFLVEIYREAEKMLYSEFFDRGFYYMRTGSTDNSMRLPKGLLSERPRKADLMKAGDLHQASIVLRGDVDISQSRRVVGAYVIQVQLTAFQNANGRTVAEVTRKFETDAGVFEGQIRSFLSGHFQEVAKDLGVQVQEAWEKGTFGANLLVVSLPRLNNYSTYSSIKSHLATHPKIKSVRDRRFSRNQTEFEVDFSGSVEELQTTLNGMRSAKFPFKVQGTGPNQVVLAPM